MSPFRSVGARLSLALLLVVAGALAIVYLIVVPSLERRLVDGRLAQLERSTGVVSRHLRANPYGWTAFDESAAVNARVVQYTYLDTSPLQLSVLQDSGTNSSEVEDDPVAMKAAEIFGGARGRVERGDRHFAEVAVALPFTPEPSLLLLSAPLDESLASVALVERRILQAGAIALLVALALGYGGARLFARRIRRLEQAAERIAAGHFDEPVEDPGRDEVGELARAFERMRERLAGLDHARREFIANASHELRTPLFSLGGYLELVEEEDLDEETRRGFVHEMREQVDRLTKLASELLDLSRLDAGRLHVEREPVELAAIAEALVTEFRPLAQARGHALQLDATADVWALGDGQRILQIGRSLVENALKHTPPGTAVQVRVERPNGRAALAVVDAGEGIAGEHRPHVFERFYRVDGTLASGSGLGLAIARELTELMGGTIELRSRPGRTEFTLTLPALADGSDDRFHVETESAVAP